MTAFVQLYLKRNRGWPWPEDSWGLTPMFGEGGWCRSCGVPRVPQSGSLVLQSKGLSGAVGAWVPNWRFDAICLGPDVADKVMHRFDVNLRKVEWHHSSQGEAYQIVAPTVGDSWFDRDQLRESALNLHRTSGAACAECGVWRWMPLAFGNLPPLKVRPELGDVDVAASPEWFGDGWKAFRQIIVRRELAEVIVANSKKDFKIQPVE